MKITVENQMVFEDEGEGTLTALGEALRKAGSDELSKLIGGQERFSKLVHEHISVAVSGVLQHYAQGLEDRLTSADREEVE